MDGENFLFSTGIEIKNENGEDVVYGYIATKDKDRVNDIITDRCLESMLSQMKDSTIKADVEHESMRGDTPTEKELNKTIIPVGKLEPVGIDKNGLKVKTTLNKNHQRYNEVKGSIKDGYLDAYSIAYIPIDAPNAKIGGEDIRFLNDVRLINVAFTGNPINTKAKITDIMLKSFSPVEITPAKKIEEVKSMVNEPNTQTKAKAEVKPEAKAEVKPVEPKAEPRIEVKNYDGEIKALTDRVEALEKFAAETKAHTVQKDAIDSVTAEVKSLREKYDKFASQPQYKAVMEDMKASISKEEIEAKSQPQGFLWLR
jgi:HK97 family phage prohead protease